MEPKIRPVFDPSKNRGKILTPPQGLGFDATKGQMMQQMQGVKST